MKKCHCKICLSNFTLKFTSANNKYKLLIINYTSDGYTNNINTTTALLLITYVSNMLDA